MFFVVVGVGAFTFTDGLPSKFFTKHSHFDIHMYCSVVHSLQFFITAVHNMQFYNFFSGCNDAHTVRACVVMCVSVYAARM